MKLYLSNIIKRLNQFSASLDKQEIFVDKPWVFIDENSNQQKYIFKRDGSLIMSLNGQVTLGKWEYIPEAKSLLIDRVQDKILLNQNFIDSAVMVLKKDGFKDDYFILANEILIPDLDVTIYLKNLYYEKNNIIAYSLNDNSYLEIHNYIGYINNNKVTIDGEPVLKGVYSNGKKKYFIGNSHVEKVLTIESNETDIGVVDIEHVYLTFTKGDKVFFNNKSAPNGKYKLSSSKHFTVENGVIKHISLWLNLNGIQEEFKSLKNN